MLVSIAGLGLLVYFKDSIFVEQFMKTYLNPQRTIRKNHKTKIYFSCDYPFNAFPRIFVPPPSPEELASSMERSTNHVRTSSSLNLHEASIGPLHPFLPREC